MPRVKKRKRRANRVIIAVVLALIALGLASYAGLFSIVQPSMAFTTWPKIAKLHLGEVYTRYGTPFGIPWEVKRAKIDYDYRPIAYEHAVKKWVEIPAPMVGMIKYERLHGATVPRSVTMKPSLWQYEEKSGWFFGTEAVMFRMDPDEPDDGAPDVEIVVKPQMDKPYGSTGFRVAAYDVHILIIGTSPHEISNFYKGSYVEIIFDSYYLIKSVKYNNKEHDAIFDDETGKTKIILHLPSAVPEQEPGDVFILQYALNWPPAEKVYAAKIPVDVIYDPNVVVATAEQTAHWTPSETATPTETTRAEGTVITETKWWTRTVFVHVTTTLYYTTYRVETVTTTVGGQPVIYTYTTTVKDTVTATVAKTTVTTGVATKTETVVVTKTVDRGGGGDFWNICLLKDPKTGKCLIAVWQAGLAAAFFTAILALIVAGSKSRSAATRAGIGLRKGVRR